MKHFPYCLIALVALASCSGSTAPDAPASSSVIIPLAVGNTWIGRQTEYRPDTVRVRFDTVTVEKDTLIGGERRSLVTSRTGYVNRSDGAYFWGFDGAPMLIYKYPAKPGDELRHAEATGPGTDSIVASITVVSTNEQVSVPAGTFSCYHYYSTSNWGQFDTHYYLAPGVGFVKMLAVGKGAQPRVDSTRWELLSVTIR